MDKNGANVYGSVDLVHASPWEIGWSTSVAPPSPWQRGRPGPSQYLSVREGGDWSTTGLLPPSRRSRQLPDRRRWVERRSHRDSGNHQLAGEPGAFDLFARDSQDGSLRQIAAGDNGGDSYAFDAATSDNQSFLFEDRADTPLVPEPRPGPTTSISGRQLVGSAWPACFPRRHDAPRAGRLRGPTYGLPQTPGTGGALEHLYTEHTISDDGSRVFFTAAGTGRGARA